MEKQNYPLITIGVSTYNRKDYLQQSLDSLLNQSYPNCEIIVIDDGSSDATDVMMREKYPQIKYVFQKNAGDAAAKNHAAKLANGDFIVFNDSDDMFLPDAVERLYNALPENDPTAISYGTYITINADGEQLPTKRKVAIYPSGVITGDLLEHIIVNNCATLMPVELYRKHGGVNEKLKAAYDYAFFLKLSCHCSFIAVQEPVFLRRRHSSNVSSASYAKLHTVWQVVERFLQDHPEVEKEYAGIVRCRRADLHSKLYREAKREKLAAEQKMHAQAAFRNRKTFRNFWRMLFA